MVLSVVVLIALLMVPGILIGIASGVRTGWAIAAAPAVTFAVAGLAGWVLGMVNIRFSVATALLSWLVVLALAALWRFVIRAGSDTKARIRGHQPLSKQRMHNALVAAPAIVGVVIGVTAMLVISLRQLAAVRYGIQSIPVSWDVHWHASVIRSILDDGMASSTRMGEIQNVETHAETYYPAAWHAVGALFATLSGNTVVATTNYMGLVVPAVVTPLSAAAIAWRMVDRASWTASIGAGLAAISTIALPVLMPISVFVGAWPYQVAIALVGVTFAVLTSVGAQPRRIFIAVLAFVGIGQLHPSAVPTVAVITFVWWIAYKIWSPSRPPSGTVRGPVVLRIREIGLILAVAIPAAALLLPQWMSGGSQEDSIRAFSAQVKVDRMEAWSRAVTMMTRHAHDFGIVVPILVTGIVGLLILAVFYRRWWPVLAWGLAVLFTTHGLKHFDGLFGDVLSAYIQLHYATPHRLIQTTALLLCAGLGAGTAIAITWISRAIAGKDAAVVSVGLATIVATLLAPYSIMRVDEAARWAYTAPRDNHIVSKYDRKAFAWLAKQPEVAGTRVFTHPSEGSAWMYPANEIQTVFHHYDWPVANKHTDTSMVYWHMNLLGVGAPGDPEGENDVDRAVEALDVSFFYSSPPNYWRYQKRHTIMADGLWWTPGVTPVYRDHEVTIYAVNSRVSDDAIDRMRKESPEHLPASATRTETGERIR
ncbi:MULTISPECIES: DUF6541 family protein [unclassified Corynebacterium]|uniref:DUF6541 family protein n=1 Tax=unclassified Corynebacterium TaxID=2624378 RepID=UPI00309FA6DF